jgi:NTP pyrophosphatase (non-canonical NTP hydrolase)
MNTGMQRQVAEFVERHGLDAAVPYRLLDLVSEVGELSKELLKSVDYGKSEPRLSGQRDTWEEELGDVLFSLICVANSTGVDLEQALRKAMAKYRERIRSERDAGSGRR